MCCWIAVQAALSASAQEERKIVRADVQEANDDHDPQQHWLDAQCKSIEARMRTEQAFIKRLCAPSEEQIEKMAAMNSEWIRQRLNPQVKAVGDVLAMAFGGRRPRVALNANAPAERNAAAQKAMLTLHTSRLKEILTADQWAKYESEIASRAKFRNLATAECIVTVLDEKLALNNQQRKALVSVISDTCDVSQVYAPFYLQNQGYLPQVPNNILKDHLTPAQMLVINGFQMVEVKRDSVAGGQPLLDLVE